MSLLLTLAAAAILVAGDGHPTRIADAMATWQGREVWHLTGCILAVFAGLLLAGWFSVARVWSVAAASAGLVLLFGLGPVVSVAYLAVVALVLGRTVLARAFAGDSLAGHGGLAVAVGYALIAGLFQISVHFPVNTPAFVILATAPVLALGHAWLPRLAAEGAAFCRAPHRPGLAATACLAVPAALAAVLLVYASYPEVHSDALMIGLEIPHQVAANGQWSFDAANYMFAVMPKAAVWLFTPHYLLGGEPAARLFNGLTALFAASLVFTEAARYAGRRAGLLLAGVFLSAPLTFWTVFVLFDDAVLNFLLTAALVAALHAWKRPGCGSVATVALLLSAAVATKLFAVFVALPIGLALAVRLWCRCSRREFAKTCAATALVFGAIGLVPYAYAFWKTGNPVHPLYNGIFKSAFFPAQNFVDPRWIGKLGLDILYRMTLHTSDFMEGSDGTFGVVHVILLPAIIIGAIGRRWTAGRLTLGLAVLFSAVELSATQYARYLYPTFAMVAVCGAMGYRRARDEGWSAGFLMLLAGISITDLALTRGLNAFYRFQLPSVLSAEWVPPAARVPERWFGRIINAREGSRSRVLHLTDRYYGYPLDGTPLYVDWHSPRLEARLAQIQTRDEALRLLDSEAITDIITDSSASELSGIRILKQEIDQLGRLEAEQDGLRLYRLDPPPLPPDTDIPLSDASGGRLFGRGWLAPEAWGTWTIDRHSDWSFRAIGRPAEADLLLSGSVLPCDCNLNDPIEVGVAVNGTPLGQLTFARRQEPQSWSLRIPHALVASDNAVRIRFTFEQRTGYPILRVGFYRFRFSYSEAPQ